jgi:protein SCO1/2
VKLRIGLGLILGLTVTAGLVTASLVTASLVTTSLGAPAKAADAPLDPQQALAQSEAALGSMLGAHQLTDSQGQPFSLADYRGQTLVISLIYTSCASVCPTTTQRLLDAVAEARRNIGADRFAVLTVGFDARNDTPQRMAAFARQQGIPLATWRVASGDTATLAALMRDLGFSYRNAAGGFDHVTQTSIIDPEGRVHRHVYGDDFPLPVFIEPLKETVFGTTTRGLNAEALIDRLRFLCTVYDPGQGRYRTSYAIALGIGIGGLSLIIAGILFGRAWIRNRRLHALAGR